MWRNEGKEGLHIMKNEQILEILNRPDVTELLTLWDLFCDYCKTTHLKVNVQTFMSYLVVLKARLENENTR